MRRYGRLMPWVLTLIATAVTVMPAAAQPFAYVTNQGSGSVSVIDVANNTVVATVPVEGRPWAVAISPGGALAYVANSDAKFVSVIDTTTNTVVASVDVGSPSTGVAVTPD